MLRRLALLSLFVAPALLARTKIVLLQFSDYHSHAIPFYSDGKDDQGGLARAVEYLRQEHRRGALVFDGGDMINRGSPAWSDKYQCAEWSWLNGVVDAMALGNHDADYGAEVFEHCRKEIRYPILSANTEGFRATEVFVVKGVRIGVFALAGSDFPSLTRGFTFSDRMAAARAAVRELRSHADVVVMIGHESTDDDYALARVVPGIDLIFGSHSHLLRPLVRIEGTQTWFISPYQYLTYISRVTMTFDHHRLAAVDGQLVPVDRRMAASPDILAKVADMQRELERDPAYEPLFRQIGTLEKPLSVDELGRTSVELMKSVVQADFALSTRSSFRQPLAAGPVTMEALRASMPYDNEIVVATMSGAELQKLIAESDRYAGTDRGTFQSDISIDPSKSYRVATIDYLTTSSPYRDFFGPVEKSGKRIRDEVRKWIAAGAATR